MGLKEINDQCKKYNDECRYLGSHKGTPQEIKDMIQKSNQWMRSYT